MRVFLCHSSGDKPRVRDLYRRLKEDGFQPWLDEVDLTPGQAWRDAIEDAVRTADAVVVCISQGSVSKEGFLQKEIRIALDIADEKPDGTIFLIPARLEEVDIPRRLRNLQWTNLYEERGYERLVGALQERGTKLPDLTHTQIVSLPRTPGITNPPPTGLRGILAWARSHLPFVIIALVLLLVAALVIVFRLNRAQREYRAEAVRLIAEGSEKLRSFQIAQAQSLLGKAVTADPDNAIAHANLAVAFTEGGNYSAAKPETQIASGLKKSLQPVQLSWVEGVTSEANWRLGDAIRSYREGWTRYRDPEAALRMAHVQTLSGKAADAQTTLVALRTSSAGPVDPRVDYESAEAADTLNDYDQEITALERIAREHPSEPIILATALSGQCWALYKQGKLDDADRHCEKALELFANEGDTLGRARTLTRQSLILSARDSGTDTTHQQAAMGLQDEALEIVRGLESQLDEAGALQNRANLWIKRNDYESARKDYDDAIKIYTSIGSEEGVAALHNNWAAALVSSCQYEEARRRYDSAKEAYKRIGSQDGVALAASNEGWMDYFLGNLSDAEKELTEALETANSLKSRLDPDWLVTLGDVQMARNNLPLAEECFRGRICSGSSNNSASTADMTSAQDVLPEGMLDFALLEIEKGNPVEAERIARKQVADAHGKDAEGEAGALDVLARALIARGGITRLIDASNSIQRAETLGVHSCWLVASLSITAARVSAHSRKEDLALEQLSNALRTARNAKLVGYELEALLARLEMESMGTQSASASGDATDLIKEAQRKGFLLIARKADEITRKNRGVKAVAN
jgi:tetratricopeptide (TPR) repeat protein